MESKAVGLPLEEYLSKARIEWHGIELGKPDWATTPTALHSLCIASPVAKCGTLRSMPIGSRWSLQLPPVTGSPKGGWLRLIDTSLPSPDDIVEETQGSPVDGSKYLVNARSVIMLHYDYVIGGQAAAHNASAA